MAIIYHMSGTFLALFVQVFSLFYKMNETLFVLLLKLFFNFYSSHHVAVTDAGCIFLPFSFVGALCLCIYEYIETLMDFCFSSMHTLGLF